MAHGDVREGKWRGNWRMEWIASTLHTTSEHGVFSINTADTHTSAASSQLNWRPRRFKWTRPFRRKTKSGFCACAITFQTQSRTELLWLEMHYQLYALIVSPSIGYDCAVNQKPNRTSWKASPTSHSNYSSERHLRWCIFLQVRHAGSCSSLAEVHRHGGDHVEK
jgi:hypothetical protein